MTLSELIEDYCFKNKILYNPKTDKKGLGYFVNLARKQEKRQEALSNYLSLTLDGMSPEEAARKLKLL